MGTAPLPDHTLTPNAIVSIGIPQLTGSCVGVISRPVALVNGVWMVYVWYRGIEYETPTVNVRPASPDDVRRYKEELDERGRQVRYPMTDMGSLPVSLPGTHASAIKTAEYDEALELLKTYGCEKPPNRTLAQWLAMKLPSQ